ncbi:hypothetical protein LSAT2_003477 [Lamellibrachia satsuma]|nr:hypothetical protein LSAT2_003477 [Lamellibrachia satsuma]
MAVVHEMIVLSVFVMSVSGAMLCWQCIAEDCDDAPRSKSTRSICLEGEACQKVEYYGTELLTNAIYLSTVRSCSRGACVPHADNCTERQSINPGCVVRHCCNDKDLCNACASTRFRFAHVAWLMSLHILQTFLLS